jgi:hypothetical protein
LVSERAAGLHEEYARGALSIFIKFDGKPGRDAGYIGKSVGPADHHITFHGTHRDSIWSHDSERRVAGSSQNGRDGDVLVRVVQFVDLVEINALPTHKCFGSPDGVFHPLAGCFYSIAGGFEVDPAVACREAEFAILRAVVVSDQIPNGVIEGGSKIVDSIAYYHGERGKRLFDETYPDRELIGLRVCLNAKSARFLVNKGIELPFKISDVILGPLDFLFGPLEPR